MDVFEALQARCSTRSFKPDPVPRETVVKILEAARHSPSSGNSQPWEVFVAGGETAARIRQGCQERFNQGTPSNPDISGIPISQWPPYLRDRMNTIASERQKLLGINPKDEAAMKIYRAFSAGLFKAPVILIIGMDRVLSVWSAFDIGLLSQSIMLAARSCGVDSMIATAFINYPEVLRRELSIPDNLQIVIGIGLGYADPGHIINTYRSPRRPVSEIATFKGI